MKIINACFKEKFKEVGIEKLIKLKIMKKTLLAIAVTAVFASCGSKTDTKTSEDAAKTLSYTDSLNIQSQLNDKANEVQLNGLSDTLVTKDGSQYVKVDPNKAAAVAEPEVKEREPVRKTTASRTKTRTRSASRSSSGTGTANSGGSGSVESSGSTGSAPVYTETETTTTTQETEKKKGWSKAAKGAAIGAGAGAVGGAIISKKKGVGAVVGGLIGAGGGYIIGRKADKKDGRAQ